MRNDQLWGKIGVVSGAKDNSLKMFTCEVCYFRNAVGGSGELMHLVTFFFFVFFFFVFFFFFLRSPQETRMRERRRRKRRRRKKRGG